MWVIVDWEKDSIGLEVIYIGGDCKVFEALCGVVVYGFSYFRF
jgi:hypothetical protein